MLLSLAFLVCYFIFTCDAVEIPKGQRSVSYDHFKENAVLAKVPQQMFNGMRASDCAHLCVATRDCLSYNYCLSQLCILNEGHVSTDGIVFRIIYRSELYLKRVPLN